MVTVRKEVYSSGKTTENPTGQVMVSDYMFIVFPLFAKFLEAQNLLTNVSKKLEHFDKNRAKMIL